MNRNSEDDLIKTQRAFLQLQMQNGHLIQENAQLKLQIFDLQKTIDEMRAALDQQKERPANDRD